MFGVMEYIFAPWVTTEWGYRGGEGEGEGRGRGGEGEGRGRGGEGKGRGIGWLRHTSHTLPLTYCFGRHVKWVEPFRLCQSEGVRSRRAGQGFGTEFPYGGGTTTPILIMRNVLSCVTWRC